MEDFSLCFYILSKRGGKCIFQIHSLFGKMKQITDHFSVNWKENQRVFELMVYFYV